MNIEYIKLYRSLIYKIVEKFRINPQAKPGDTHFILLELKVGKDKYTSAPVALIPSELKEVYKRELQLFKKNILQYQKI